MVSCRPEQRPPAASARPPARWTTCAAARAALLLVASPAALAASAHPGSAAGQVHHLPAHLSPTMPARAPSDEAQAAIAFALPEGLPAATAAKVALGERLFFDRRLSIDGTVSCATCHVPSRGFVDHLPTSEGVGKQRGQRNTPTVLNAALQEQQFWDGRSSTLEQQAKLPILNPIEMGQRSAADVEAILRANPDYVRDFQAIYQKLDFAAVADAIAAYERTQIALDSPFDAYRRGEVGAMGAAAKRGFDLFNGKARCSGCHGANAINPLFSDQKFHNIGIAAQNNNFSALASRAAGAVDHDNVDQIDEMALGSTYSLLGRFLVTKQRHDIGAFKTQTLRNIGLTAPYMHDGSLPTLWDVVDHYNRGGIANPYLDGGMQALGLTEHEVDDVVAFLFALTDHRFSKLNAAEQRAQAAIAAHHRPQRDTAAAMGKKDHFGDIGLASSQKNMGKAGAY